MTGVPNVSPVCPRTNPVGALKILPARFVRDPDRVRRFEQEARAASSLNHPNIVTIHEIGVGEDRQFIASELVEGETLRVRLHGGRLPLEEAVSIRRAGGGRPRRLRPRSTCHTRDIKPQTSSSGRTELVKIVDFGLAN